MKEVVIVGAGGLESRIQQDNDNIDEPMGGVAFVPRDSFFFMAQYGTVHTPNVCVPYVRTYRYIDLLNHVESHPEK